MNPWKPRRKKVYVSNEIQGHIVSKLAVYWATYHLALWHAMFLFHYFLYRGRLMVDPEMAPIPFPIQYFQFLTQHYIMLLCAVAVFPLILWDMVKITHRVAGPLVRFTNSLKQLERGEKVKAIKLRDGDLLGEFQDAFNSYLKTCHLLEEDPMTARWSAETPVAGQPDKSDAGAESEVLNEVRQLTQVVSPPPAGTPDAARDESRPAQTVVVSPADMQAVSGAEPESAGESESENSRFSTRTPSE